MVFKKVIDMKIALKYSLIVFFGLTIFAVLSAIYSHLFIIPMDDQDYIIKGVGFTVFMSINLLFSLLVFLTIWLVKFVFFKSREINQPKNFLPKNWGQQLVDSLNKTVSERHKTK